MNFWQKRLWAWVAALTNSSRLWWTLLRLVWELLLLVWELLLYWKLLLVWELLRLVWELLLMRKLLLEWKLLSSKKLLLEDFQAAAVCWQLPPFNRLSKFWVLRRCCLLQKPQLPHMLQVWGHCITWVIHLSSIQGLLASLGLFLLDTKSNTAFAFMPLSEGLYLGVPQVLVTFPYCQVLELLIPTAENFSAAHFCQSPFWLSIALPY